MPDLPSGHIDKFDIKVVRNQSSQVNDIEQGNANWMFDPPPPDRYAEVKAKYDGTQFRVEPGINTYYFWMNTRKPPFDDPKVRQAVNYAVDSSALERIYGGRLASTQQILPPGMPGYKKFVLYPHNMSKAKQLLQEANPSDKDITVWTDDTSPNDEAGTYYQDVLTKMGFNTSLKILNSDNYFTIIGNAKTPDLDAGWSDWLEDYPHPSDFFDPLLNGENIAPVNNNNFANFDDPKVEREDQRAVPAAARSVADRPVRGARPPGHGAGSLGSLRDPDLFHVRFERHQSRQDHLEPDLRGRLHEHPVQVGA